MRHLHLIEELKLILEALLVSADSPLSVDKMREVFEQGQRPSKEEVLKAIALLEKDYQTRAFELIEVASGYRIQTKKKYSEWISSLQAERPIKYSRALLETLAIIAYKQPVTRADIEEIRGVSVNSQIIKNLIEREWIRIAGYKDVPGRPAVYVSTKSFLDYFNLKNLDELPSLVELFETNTNECIDE